MTLSRELMGVFCLGVLWMTALLVAGAAWQELRDLAKLAASLRDVISGTIVEGVFASHEVEQTGRALDSATPTIVFHDRGYASRIHGGRVESNGETLELSSSAGEVWVDPRASALAMQSDGAFDDEWAASKKSKGTHRVVQTTLRAGDRVFVARDANGAVAIVSALDPRKFVASRRALVLAFIVVEILACAGCTRLALWSPVFGPISTLGGALCLAYFLAVTPAGVAVRDACRPPSRAVVRGRWSRGGATAALAQRA